VNENALAQDTRRYLSMLHKRRALIVTCLAVAVLLAFLYNHTARPLYQATAQILIDTETPDLLEAQELADRGEVRDMQTQLQLLRGRTLAELVVKDVGLERSEEFLKGPLMTPAEYLKKVIGRTPSFAVDAAGNPLRPTIAAFRSRLVVEPVPGSLLVNLHFRAYDPETAALAANALARLFIERSFEIRNSTTGEATGILEEQMEAQRTGIQELEAEIQRYQKSSGRGNIEERQQLLDQKLTALGQATVEARMERIEKETLLGQIRSVAPSQVDRFPYVMRNPLIQRLRSDLAELERERNRLAQTLGDRHPDMVRLNREVAALEQEIRTEVQGVVSSLENDARAARQREVNLQADVEAAKRESLDLGESAVDYNALKRQLQAAQELYQNLVRRSRETGLQAEIGQAARTDEGRSAFGSNVRIIEQAEVPGGTISPNPTRNYQLAVLLGLALGIGLALLLEQLDNTVKTPDDVKLELGLPFLGMVPQADDRAALRQSQREGVGSGVKEAYRLLRTNLIFSSADRTGRVLVVSSANPGEGKTTTVANIAISLAQNGAKVLAVDADLRKPTLHQHFAIHKTPGLSDLIVGKCQPSDSVQVTRFKGLHVLPCGYIPPNPAELLGSRNMNEVLAALRSHYDWVLIDSAPILGMADTPVLSAAADGVALVVSAESTTRPAILRAVDQIQSVGGRLLGLVLNRVNLERNSYYYGQYYGEYYRSYYNQGAKRRDKPIREVRRRA
jgi:capsular exopolysaccharide synthesis family protein